MCKRFKQFKSKIDKLDLDKLAPVPVDLSKLTDAVKYDVFKKTYYNTNIKDIEDKIFDVATTAVLTTVENKIPDQTDILLLQN